MKRILPAIFILSLVQANASEWTFRPDSGYRFSAGLSSLYYFESNAITNAFALDYFNAAFIDNESKDPVSENLESENRFGTGFHSKLWYSWENRKLFGLSNSSLSLSFGNHYHVNSTFRRDAIEIYFRGNKAFAGKTAELGAFEYNQVIYQQLKMTFGHRFNRENNLYEYTVGLGLNKGQKLYQVNSEHATLYTETRGEYLLLDADLQLHQSDSSGGDLYDWNGTGGSADFTFSWENQNGHTLKLTANNFGFIQWNNKTAHIDADSLFRFDGIDVSDLFNFSDSITETISIDSSLVEPYLSNRETKMYTSPLPAFLGLSYFHVLSPGKFDLGAEISYLFFAGALPKESLTFGYHPHRDHRLELKASYGGYTGFHGGIAYKTWFMDRFLLTIQSDYLNIILGTSNSTAQGAFVSLSAYF